MKRYYKLNNRWANISDYFEDPLIVQGEEFTPQEIAEMNPEFIDQVYIKPVRDMIQNELVVRAYPNGDVEKFYQYNVFPEFMVDNIPLLNVYAQRIHNDVVVDYAVANGFICENDEDCMSDMMEDNDEDEIRFDYSGL